MEIKINAIELASELAHDMVCAKFNDDDNAIHMEDANGIYYTEEAQDVFNEWYDHYLHKIEQCNVIKPKLLCQTIKLS
jgi:uncharacterized Zn finger protein